MSLGLLQPFRRGPNDFVSGNGDSELRSEIEQVIGTEGSVGANIGEIPWRPEMGSGVHLILHAPESEATIELARIYCADALSRCLPSAQLNGVDVDVAGSGKVSLTVRVNTAEGEVAAPLEVQ